MKWGQAGLKLQPLVKLKLALKLQRLEVSDVSFSQLQF